jgi:hypothetical protein
VTFAEAFQNSNINTARVIEADKICAILNLAQEVIWRMYPWRWTIAELEPFWLIPYEQDYGSPIVAVPANFYEIQAASIVRINNLLSSRFPLRVQRGLEKTSLVSRPDTICYVPEKSCFRVHPRPSEAYCCPDYLIEGFYKKTPVIITPENYQTTNLPSPEAMRHIWHDAITWAYLTISKDFQNAERAYQALQRTLAETAASETTALGNPHIHPSEPIVSGGHFAIFPRTLP